VAREAGRDVHVCKGSIPRLPQRQAIDLPMHAKNQTGTVEGIKKQLGLNRESACVIRSIEKQGSGYVVTFPDIPEAITRGKPEDSLQHAQDALESAMEFYFEERRRVPALPNPSQQHVVELPASLTAKVLS